MEQTNNHTNAAALWTGIIRGGNGSPLSCPTSFSHSMQTCPHLGDFTGPGVELASLLASLFSKIPQKSSVPCLHYQHSSCSSDVFPCPTSGHVLIEHLGNDIAVSKLNVSPHFNEITTHENPQRTVGGHYMAYDVTPINPAYRHALYHIPDIKIFHHLST